MNFANQVIERCQSTNDLARDLAEKGYPHGTWISSRIQESGRGRLGRKWSSIEGNLFLSYLTRIEPKALWSWIPLTTAVAIAQCLIRHFPDLGIRVKWPNDLWIVQPGVEGKLGGILCEGASSIHSFVVVGIGLNCRAAPDPQEVGQPVVDLASSVRIRELSADDIRAPLIESLNRCFERLKVEGTNWIARDYEKMSLFAPGTSVCWGDPAHEAKVIGLGPSAELRVQYASGDVRHLFSEEVRVRPSGLNWDVGRSLLKAGGSRP